MTPATNRTCRRRIANAVLVLGAFVGTTAATHNAAAAPPAMRLRTGGARITDIEVRDFPSGEFFVRRPVNPKGKATVRLTNHLVNGTGDSQANITRPKPGHGEIDQFDLRPVPFPDDLPTAADVPADVSTVGWGDWTIRSHAASPQSIRIGAGVNYQKRVVRPSAAAEKVRIRSRYDDPFSFSNTDADATHMYIDGLSISPGFGAGTTFGQAVDDDPPNPELGLLVFDAAESEMTFTARVAPGIINEPDDFWNASPPLGAIDLYTIHLRVNQDAMGNRTLIPNITLGESNEFFDISLTSGDINAAEASLVLGFDATGTLTADLERLFTISFDPKPGVDHYTFGNSDAYDIAAYVVPEPSTAVLAGLLSTSLFIRRKRRLPMPIASGPALRIPVGRHSVNRSNDRCLRLKLTMVCVAISLFAGRVTVADTSVIRTVALSGEQAPGTDVGVTFSGFNVRTMIDEAGNVTLSASLAGPGVSGQNSNGIWRDANGALSLVARGRDQASGLPIGLQYNGVDLPVMSNDIGIVFRTGLFGPGIDSSNNICIYSDASGSLNCIAREGEIPPDVGANIRYDNLGTIPVWGSTHPTMNGFGDVAFTGSLTGTGVVPGTEVAIWSNSPGAMSVIARTAPTPRASDDIAGIGNPIICSNGIVGFPANLGDSRIALFTSDGVTLTRVIAVGDAAPGTNPGVTFQSINTAIALGLSTDGRISFRAVLTGVGVTSANDTGFWQQDELGDIQLVMREGDNAPTLPGMTFGDATYAVMSGNGKLGAVPSLLPGNFGSIWTQNDAGDLLLIARPTQQVFAMPTGVVFATTPPLNVFPASELFMNEIGDMLFLSNIAGPGITTSNNQALFEWRADGQTAMLIQKGDAIEIAPGDMRTVSVIALTTPASGGDDGRSSPFNTSGDIAMKLEFTDGSSGIFVAKRSDTPTCVLPGDLNDDGLIDGRDIQHFVLCVVDNAMGCSCADVDGNGTPDTDDIQVFVQCLLIGNCN